jgi:hypothetical protein
MQRLFFFHLPKAAGTSVHAALASAFAEDRVAPRIENDIDSHEANGGRYAGFRGYDLYSGHYGADIFRAVADGHECVTNFRHPVARIISLYRYFRSVPVSDSDLAKPHFRAVRMAKTASLAEFVASDDELLLTYTSNHHARQLTASGWSLRPEAELEQAVSSVDRMLWFFVCEEPQRSHRWLSRALGIREVPTVNVTDSSTFVEVGPDLVESILERNRLDLALYNRALARLRHEADRS